MKELQRRGMRASLVYDQIFVNGRAYDETRVERPNPAKPGIARTTHQTIVDIQI